MDALSVKELAYDKRGLQKADGEKVVGHGSIVIVLVVKVICIPSLHLCNHSAVCLHRARS